MLRQGLHLNAFRGEPAISGFAWHFTPTHRSSLPFAIDTGSGLHARDPRASPCPWVDHPVSGRLNATGRPFGLGFPPAPAVAALTSPRRTTRRLILQKARRHQNHSWLRQAGGTRFQGLFHSPCRGAFHHSLTVLVHYRSLVVFSLGRWSPQLPTRFRVSGGTHGSAAHRSDKRRLRGSHPLRPPVPAVFGCLSIPCERAAARSQHTVQPHDDSASRLLRRHGLGSTPFARRYSGYPLFSSGY